MTNALRLAEHLVRMTYKATRACIILSIKNFRSIRQQRSLPKTDASPILYITFHCFIYSFEVSILRHNLHATKGEHVKLQQIKKIKFLTLQAKQNQEFRGASNFVRAAV